ncbi:hypothetical protein BHM03_00045835 [Ensete ventricosum]|nr:hypothetical protein BHM03_00045835 [Ensete ventricosum]
MYRSTSRSACEPPATRWYQVFGLVSGNMRLYRAVTIKISIISDLYGLVPIDFNHYRPVPSSTDRNRTLPNGYRYADRPLPGGSVKNRSSAIDFDRRRSISTVGDRFRPSAIDFDRRWPIEGEIDCRRSISIVGSRLRDPDAPFLNFVCHLLADLMWLHFGRMIADDYDGLVREITFRSPCHSPLCPPDTAVTEWQHAVLSNDKATLVYETVQQAHDVPFGSCFEVLNNSILITNCVELSKLLSRWAT